MPFDIKEIWLHLRTVRNEFKDNHIEGYVKIMAYFMKVLSQSLSDDDEEFVYQMLSDTQADYGYLNAAEKTITETTIRFPNSPLTWIRASGFYLTTINDSEKALLMANRAIEAAQKSGKFIVHAYNTKCRAARANKNYKLLSNTIEKILDLPSINISIDSAYEHDFIENLPCGSIDNELADRLRDRCEKQRQRKIKY